MVVVNPASYRHPVTTGSGAGVSLGVVGCSVGGGCSVVVCVSGTRLRCWFMIGSVPSLSFFGPEGLDTEGLPGPVERECLVCRRP